MIKRIMGIEDLSDLCDKPETCLEPDSVGYDIWKTPKFPFQVFVILGLSYYMGHHRLGPARGLESLGGVQGTRDQRGAAYPTHEQLDGLLGRLLCCGNTSCASRCH